MKIFYHGPRSNPGDHVGRAGELRIVSLAGLWGKVREAMRDGGILRLAHKPTMAYLRAASEGSEPQCLLCGTVLEAETAPLSMMVFVLPYQPKRDPALVSALCGPCCEAERDDDRLLLKVETELQMADIVREGVGEAPLTLTRQ
jgi:hypothetical protein